MSNRELETAGLPEWSRRASALERADKLDEAEKLIWDTLHPNLPAAHATAGLYRDRLFRLIAEGRWDDAAVARARAIRWIRVNSAGATSGGEGAASQVVEDLFIRSLPNPSEVRARESKLAEGLPL